MTIQDELDEYKCKLAQAKEIILLMKITEIIWNTNVKSSGDLGQDVIEARKIAVNQLSEKYPELGLWG